MTSSRSSCSLSLYWAAALLALGAGARAAPPALVPLQPNEFDPIGLRAETQWRHQVNHAMQVEFHRAQAFRWQAAGPAHAVNVVSLLGWADGAAAASGADAHCALVLEQRGGAQAFDALATDGDMPWSCEGEPAITSTDVDGDRIADLLVLYPYRAPSGDRFMLPLVFVYRPAQAALVLDEAETRRLRARKEPITDLRSMKQALRAR